MSGVAIFAFLALVNIYPYIPVCAGPDVIQDRVSGGLSAQWHYALII